MKNNKLYEIFDERIYKREQELSFDKPFSYTFPKKIDENYNYILNVVGEVAFDYFSRYERIMPKYYRKLDDSIKFIDGEKVLVFNDENKASERTCYTLIRNGIKDDTLSFNLNSKISGVYTDFYASIEIYYGESRTRYYYEKPDECYKIDLKQSGDFVQNTVDVKVNGKVDFIMIKVSALNFDGSAEIYAPKLLDGDNNICPDFDYCPDEIDDFNWIGDGFSLVEKPKYKIYVNENEIFSGRIMDRLQRFAGFNVNIPFDFLKDKNNEIKIVYDKDNIKNYTIKKVRLLYSPKNFEFLGLIKTVKVDDDFSVFAYSISDEVKPEKSSFYDFLGITRLNEKYILMNFHAIKTGYNIPIVVNSGANVEKDFNIVEQIEENIITGTGDFIYLKHDIDEFAMYMSWYLNNSIGKLLTFRCVYHWGGCDEINLDFWKFAVKLLSGLKIKYSLMQDGRELVGINSSPTEDMLKSDYFLGQQTHERDGAFIYWDQSLTLLEENYYHILSRKINYNGMNGKFSPVYDEDKNAYMYFNQSLKVSSQKEAYDIFVENLRRTGADGAKRHTGVTTNFNTFFEVGYKWIGYESMYGPHELMFGAIRGAVNNNDAKGFGTHLALQWSTVPTDDPKHFIRYKLSLLLSYMHGATEINTEEGLWRIENPFADFDNYSYSCVGHREEQTKFNNFINTHIRRGKIKNSIAMIKGKYDAMEGFSSPYVFGYKKYKYDKPEESWDLLKLFYPESDINAIYYYIKRGGRKNVPQKDKELMEIRKGLYRDVIDYKQVGFYTNTPYGTIDIIPSESKNFKDYKLLFFTGWNTAEESQLIKLCDYVENGGKLIICKPHLYDTVSREKALGGKLDITENQYAKRLLSHVNDGNVIYFDYDKYPIEYRDEFTTKLKEFAKEYKNPYIFDTKHLSYTEYEQENKSSVFYLLNINWWDNKPAEYTLKVNGKKYKQTIKDNDIRVLYCFNDTAFYLDNKKIDARFISENEIELIGNGKTNIYVFGQCERKINTKISGKISFRI